MLSFASAECWEMSASSLSSSSNNNNQLNNQLGLCLSLKMEETGKVVMNEKQGIVSILGSDCERAKAASLRRTLSADMSSRKWLAQHGFSSFPSSSSASSSHMMMRKISSSQQFPTTTIHAASTSELGKLDDDDHSCGAGAPAMTFQTWSSILSQNEEPAGAPAKPATYYVHPLVKRSSASLSDKSLQICTESLGSETGSDGFSSSSSSSSSPPPSPNTLQQVLYQLENEKEEEDYSQSEMENYYPLVRKRLQPPSSSSFPPPLPSLSATQAPYNNVRFQTHRQDGRLVLEAVSVPAQNYFQAQRHEGRLILTWAPATTTTTPFNHQRMTHQDEADQEFDSSGENETQMDDEKNGEAAAAGKKGMEMEALPKLPTGMMSVHRSALMMKKKLMGLVNINPAWPPKLNEATQLLAPAPTPPRVARMMTTPPAAAAAAAAAGAAAPSSFNAYEYCWRSKPPTATATAVFKGSKAHEQQQLLLLRGNKAEYYSVALLRGCKEPRRSLLIWEPHCIATS